MLFAVKHTFVNFLEPTSEMDEDEDVSDDQEMENSSGDEQYAVRVLSIELII